MRRKVPAECKNFYFDKKFQEWLESTDEEN
jgi:hypothetical protein